MPHAGRARVAGPDADRLVEALAAAGVEVTDAAASLVHVTLQPPDLDGIEDAIAGWVDAARAAAGEDGDVVTVVADALVDGEDPAALAVGHGLVSATRAYAMERERSGGVANIVTVDPERLDAAAATVAFLLERRALSGDVLMAGARRHGRQRL